MSDAKQQINDTIAELEKRLGGLQAMVGVRPAVPPIGPLTPSPILDGAGAPTPATTTPFRTPGGQPAARENPFVPPTPPPLPLTPLWTNGPKDAAPTERLSTDGAERVAYETSDTTDACGGPIWRRAALPFSPEAEKKVAQHLGLGPHVAHAVMALRTIALGDMSPEQKVALAHNTLVKLGLLEGPVLTRPEPPTAAPADFLVEATVVQVSHVDCALLVVTCPHRPKVGGTFYQDGYEGRIVRVLAKDQGYDIVVEGSGKPHEGSWHYTAPVSVLPTATVKPG